MKTSSSAHWAERALSLIEIIIVIAIILIIFGGFFFILSPVERFAKARNQEREVHVNLLLNSLNQRLNDTKGGFTCDAGFPPTSTPSRVSAGPGGYDLIPCLYPKFITKVPIDPKNPDAYFFNPFDYDTGYYIIMNATTSRVTVSAPSAELGEMISVTR